MHGRVVAALEPVRDRPPIFEQPFRRVARRFGEQLLWRHGVRLSHGVEHVGEFCVLRRLAGIDDIPKRRRLRWRRFGVETGKIKLAQIGGDMTEATVGVPSPKLVPVMSEKSSLVRCDQAT